MWCHVVLFLFPVAAQLRGKHLKRSERDLINRGVLHHEFRCSTFFFHPLLKVISLLQSSVICVDCQCCAMTVFCVCVLCRLDFERRREEIEREFEEKVALIRREVELEKERLREELGVGGVLHWRSGASGSSSASRSGSSSPLAGVVHPEVEQPLGCQWDERKASRPPSTCESCSSTEESTLGVPPCHYRQVLGEESEPDKAAVLPIKRTSAPDADGYVVSSTVQGFEPGVCVLRTYVGAVWLCYY